MGINSTISIGNSDDRLTQAEWSAFIAGMRALLHSDQWVSELRIHGEWFSGPDQPWQNANWCVEILPPAWWRAAVERAGRHPLMADPMTSASAAFNRDNEMSEARYRLRNDVRDLCRRYSQDSFAWTTAPVELIQTGWTGPVPLPSRRPVTEAEWAQAAKEGWLTVLDPLDNRSRRQLGPQSVYLNQEDRQRIHEVLSNPEAGGSVPPISKQAQAMIDQREMEEADRRRFRPSTLGAAKASEATTPAPASTGDDDDDPQGSAGITMKPSEAAKRRRTPACDDFQADEYSSRCGVCSQPFENHKVT